MSAHEKAAKARARMDQVRREMAERRALRTRNARAARDRAADSLRKQGPVAAQVAKHMGELGRRRAQAGGWATENTERDKSYIMGFGGEEGGEAAATPAFVFRPTRPREEPPPGGLGAIEEDAAPRSASPPAPQPAPEPPKPPPVRRPSRAPEVLDDEDDFSNQSSWMNRQ